MKDQQLVAKRAIECRKIRLFIAQNPGKTRKEIFEGTGIRPTDSRLFKMVGMGIISFTKELEPDGTCPQRWFVVPQ